MKHFVGIVHVSLSIIVFCGAGTIMWLNEKKIDPQPEYLEIRLKDTMAIRNTVVNVQKNFPLYEKSLKNLKKAVAPFKRRVDSVVNFRNYTVLKKKPFYSFCNSFSNLQRALGEIEESLDSAQLTFKELSPDCNHNIAASLDKNIAFMRQAQIQHEYNARNQRCIFMITLGLYVVFGIFLLTNGIRCIQAEKPKEAVCKK